MVRVRAWVAVVGMVASLVAATAFAQPARGDDPYRQQRRMELRQQLEAERERWRHPGHPAPGHPGHPGHPAQRGWSAPGPHGGPPAGHGGRLSPDERRALREALREHRP